MNNITINLSAEDRACLNRLTEALEGMAALETLILGAVRQLNATAPDAPENKAQDEKTEETTNTPPQTEKPTQAKNESDSKAPEVTEEDIRSKYMSLSASTKKGVKDQAREIIKGYASKISLIPTDKRAEVLEKLTALEG